MTPEFRATFVRNAPTFWDEMHDPDGLNLDLGALAGFPRQILLTAGDASAPFFAAVAEAIATAVPAVRYELLHGADHVPHLSAPDLYLRAYNRLPYVTCRLDLTDGCVLAAGKGPTAAATRAALGIEAGDLHRAHCEGRCRHHKPAGASLVFANSASMVRDPTAGLDERPRIPAKQNSGASEVRYRGATEPELPAAPGRALLPGRWRREL